MPKVERQRLHDMVVEHIRRFIVEGRVGPRHEAQRAGVVRTLGISRTPLREALKVLAAEGLIEISPNRGATVSQMTEAEIREMFELMSGLEAFSGELACRADHRGRSWPRSRRCITRCSRAARKTICRGTTAATRPFTTRSTKRHAIRRLRQTYISVNRRLQALRFRSNFQVPKWDRAIHDHEEMIRGAGSA